MQNAIQRKIIITEIMRPAWLVPLSVALAMLVVSNNIGVVHAQAVGSIEITEVMYEPRTGSSWIEVLNASDSGIDLTTLKVKVGTTETAIATSGDTTATLASGALAIIAKDAGDFGDSTIYAGYTTTPLYTSAFALPAADDTTVAMVKADGTALHTVTYNQDMRAEGTGVSLHIGLANALVSAPATPGEIALNPIHSRFAPQTADMVVVSSTEGGTKTNAITFLGDGNKIHLDLLDVNPLDAYTVQIAFAGGVWTTVTGVDVAGAVNKRFTHTIVAGDTSGEVTYRVQKSGSTVASGAVTHENGRVAIDRDTPTASFTTTPPHNTSRKLVTATLTDTHLPEEVHYKLHTRACTSGTIYAEAQGEQVSPVVMDDGNAVAKFLIAGTDNNNKYVCMKITDLSGKTAYTSSSVLSGIVNTLQITELHYTPSAGTQHEWIEVQNYETRSVVPTDFEIVDGGTVRSISDYTGSAYTPRTSLAPGDTAIIAKNPDDFLTDFPSYRGPLFRSSFSLNDKGETIGLQLTTDEVVFDSVTYASEDVTDTADISLHILRSGVMSEGAPTPGTTSEALPSPASSSGGGGSQPTQTRNDTAPTVTVLSFDGVQTPAGQNLFFTQKDFVELKIKVADDSTAYTTSNLATHLTSMITDRHSPGTMQSRIEEGTKTTDTDGDLQVTYTVYFAQQAGQNAADNRVKIRFNLADSDGNTNSKREVITVARNTTAPTVANATSASILGFAASDATNVIVPVTVQNLAFGDWGRFSFVGSCGDALTQFAVRNGSHGILYEMETGESHSNCALTVTDTAGNTRTLNLPRILIAE